MYEKKILLENKSDKNKKKNKIKYKKYGQNYTINLNERTLKHVQ